MVGYTLIRLDLKSYQTMQGPLCGYDQFSLITATDLTAEQEQGMDYTSTLRTGHIDQRRDLQHMYEPKSAQQSQERIKLFWSW